MRGSLYVVATPIGNMEEMTARALEVLSTVGLIVAEDTRTTKKLLNLLGIKAPKIISYHKFNEVSKITPILEKLHSGENVALVSDAGTPCISDPGYLLVAAAAQSGINVVGVSGPSSMVTALSVSGFPAEPSLFVGFLPRKEKEIVNLFNNTFTTAAFPAVVVFFESPRRIVATMKLLSDHFPEALVCLCNDISKMFEHIYRGSPQNVHEALLENPNAEKGEYTCVFYMQQAPVRSTENGPLLERTLEGRLVDLIVKSGYSISMKEAVSILSKTLKDTTKKDIYAASLRLKETL